MIVAKELAMKARRLRGLLAILVFVPLAAQAQMAPQLALKQVLVPDESDFASQRHWQFGAALDADRNTLAVGLGRGASAGAVAIFTRTAQGIWSREATLMPSDSTLFDQFGYGVAIDGNTLLVNNGSHDLYVFERNRGVWRQKQKFSLSEQEFLSGVIDFRQRTAAITAADETIGAGVVIVLTRSAHGKFKRTATLRPSGPQAPGGPPGGLAFNPSGNTLLVGVPSEGGFQGAAYIFRSHGGRWVEHQKLIAINGAPGDEFGFSVALDNRFAMVGAPQAIRPGVFGNGAGYVFIRQGNLRYEQYELQPPANQWPFGLGALGHAVAITKDSLTISAPFIAPPSVVFVYERNLSQPILKATANEQGFFQGAALASTGTTLFAGVAQFEAGGQVNIYDTSDTP
jgi:hypothetical protein